MNKNRAFTLIELMVVISIIGIMATVIVMSLDKARGKARDDKRAADLAQIELALRLYVEQNKHYPKESDGYSGGTAGQICKSCNGPINSEIQTYLGFIPEDPKNDSTYYYYYDAKQSCGGSSNKIVLFANTMETAKYKNSSDTVCASWGGEGGAGNADSYMIIIGDSEG